MDVNIRPGQIWTTKLGQIEVLGGKANLCYPVRGIGSYTVWGWLREDDFQELVPQVVCPECDASMIFADDYLCQMCRGLESHRQL